MFNTGQQSLNIFNNSNNNQSSNMFNNQNNTGNNNNMGTNNIFNRNNNTGNTFNNNNNMNNNMNNNNNTGILFGGNTGTVGQANNTAFSIFNKGPTQNTNTGGLFNTNNQPTGALMNNGQQGNNLLNNPQGNNQGGLFANNMNQNNNQVFNSPNQQNNFFNQQGQPMNNLNMNNNPLVGANNSMINPQNLYQYSPEQQEQILRAYTPEYIKQLIQNCLKELDSNNFQLFALHNQNILKSQKVTKIAQQFNIKPQLIHVKKQFNAKLKQPIEQLKKRKTQLETMTNQFAFKVYQKLQAYKQRLIESVSISKMVNQIKSQIDQIDLQIKDFLRPLFNANQTRGNHSFSDPDIFCVKISEKILKNMSNLDNRMDQLLVCEGQVSDQQIDAGQVIEQLVQYYQNVAITLKQFTERYNKMKRLALNKHRYGNSDEILRKIHEKAYQNVNKQMQPYELLKQIEGILQKRQRKSMQYKL